MVGQTVAVPLPAHMTGTLAMSASEGLTNSEGLSGGLYCGDRYDEHTCSLVTCHTSRLLTTSLMYPPFELQHHCDWSTEMHAVWVRWGGGGSVGYICGVLFYVASLTRNSSRINRDMTLEFGINEWYSLTTTCQFKCDQKLHQLTNTWYENIFKWSLYAPQATATVLLDKVGAYQTQSSQ